MEETNSIIDLKERYPGVWSADIERELSAKVRTLEGEIDAAARPQFEDVEMSEQRFNSDGADEKSWNHDIVLFGMQCPHVDMSFWQARWEACQDDDERTVLYAAMLHFWRLELVRRREEKKRRKVREKVAKWLEGLEKRLQHLEKINCLMRKCFGRVPAGCDLAAPTLTSSDLAALERLLKVMSENRKLTELCDRIGRQVGRTDEKKEKLVEETRHDMKPIRSEEVREELSGVVVGRSIEDALPSELAACGDEEIGTLFDLKFIEGQMTCFEKSGEDFLDVTSKEKVKRKMDEEKGPIIICVDTSGSMSGDPEMVAKAVALTLSLKAREQRRVCHIIEFSTSIKAMDVGEGTPFAEIVHFVAESFGGGTDADAALRVGIEAMERVNYKNADLLMVSDMEFGDQPEKMGLRMDRQRLKGSRFYALKVGGSIFGDVLRFFAKNREVESNSLSHYDESWEYDSSNGEIKNVKRRQDKIAAPLVVTK